jgi:predicted anti-sigma-YlaC factor YlaD
MLTCKDVSKLVSESLEHELPFRQRLGVRTHLMMCSLCRQYKRQSLLLRELFRRMARSEEEQPSSREHLTEATRERIKRALRTGRE